MMISIWWLLPVSMVSAGVGMLIMALCVMSGEDDKKANRARTIDVYKK